MVDSVYISLFAFEDIVKPLSFPIQRQNMASSKLLPSLAKTASKITTTAPKSSLWLPSSQRGMASVVHPVTQDSMSKHGPTAMVFMNMGGPSTTDDVGSFLSRLFVRC